MINASGVTGAAPIWNAFMEAVLADPELMEALNMPQEDSAWEFPAPDTVEQRSISCPRGVKCPETEYFTSNWLKLLENLPIQTDSAAGGDMRTVYANIGQGSRPMGACSDTQGESRLLLRMPNGIGGALPWYSEENSERISADTEYAKRVSAERTEAMRWSGRNQQPLYLGSCAQADTLVRQFFGNAVVAVSISGYTDAVAQSPEDENRTEETGPSVAVTSGGAVLAAATPPQAVGSSYYGLVGVAHDRNCGGNFVIGTVTNGNGQAVAGVRVLYSDQFGNRIETVTSGQMPGYGSFRFAIGGDAPQTINVTLLGSNGAAISPTASVPHMQGSQTDLGCHYTIWKGVD